MWLIYKVWIYAKQSIPDSQIFPQFSAPILGTQWSIFFSEINDPQSRGALGH